MLFESAEQKYKTRKSISQDLYILKNISHKFMR